MIEGRNGNARRPRDARPYAAARPRRRAAATCAALAAIAGLGIASAGCVRTRTQFVTPLDTLRTSIAPAVQAPSAVAATSAATAVSMRGVDFHVAPAVVLRVRRLAGEFSSLTPGAPVDFDDKQSFVIRIATADAGLRTADLGRLLNQHVFAYPNAPLIDLVVTAQGSQLKLRGKLRKGGDVPFEIIASLSPTPSGELRVRPTSIRIARVPAGGLLRLVGVQLDDVIDLRGARGARVAGNDIYLDPERMLPPPRLRGHVVAVRVAGDEVRLTFDRPSLAPTASAADAPPDTSSNYLYFRHGTLRIGKLFMVDADLQIVDDAPEDPFDFSLDEYVRQLVAGYVRNTAVRGLVVHAPDLDALAQGATRTPF